MSWNEIVRCGVSGGTPGADSADYVLFDSTKHLSGASLNSMGINRIVFTVNNSQAGTRKAYWSQDGGTTWNLYDSTAVTAASAGSMSGPFDYLVDPYKDWKLTWTNGGSAQATWIPSLELICGQRHSGT